jgi:hypothetical protein
MKLDDFQRSERDGLARYVAPVADSTGADVCELVVAGPDEVVREALGDTELEPRVDPRGTEEEWRKLLEPVRRAELEALGELAALEGLPELDPAPPTPRWDPRTSMAISLRRVRGEGTFYVLAIPWMRMQTGESFVVILPPVCACYATVAPVMPGPGDVDLFLSLNGFFTPVVAASTTRGTSAEQVTFSRACWPWTHFFPFFNLVGVKFSGVTSFFAGAFL